MAQTPSQMTPLGGEAPDFNLPNCLGGTVSRDEARGVKGLLVAFICNHCPFVIHVRGELAAIGREYQDKGIGIVAISSNNIETHPDDSPEKMAIEVETVGYTFPYLYDETQEVAKAYRAACTPDFYLYDTDLKLAYRGQLDGSRPGNDVPVTGEDMRSALDALVAGYTPAPDQKPSIGCNIKWKPGNEPDYFG